MSLPVPLGALAERILAFGEVAFLITVAEDGLPHTVSVAVRWSGADLVAGAGGRTSANVSGRPGVTLLWPAPSGDPYCLIVDGTATLQPEEQTVTISPTAAVLHRLAGADSSLPSCVRLLPA